MTIRYCWGQKYEQHWLTVRHQLLRYTQLNTRCLLTEQAKNKMFVDRTGEDVISCLTGNVATVSHAVKSHKLWHSTKHAACCESHKFVH